jgi:transcription antitermination factor NusA-like protein
MAKKKMAVGPLTNKEKEYINKNRDKGVELLAKKLGRRVEAVDRFLNGPKEPAKEIKPVNRNDPEAFVMNNLLAKREGYSVVVMTESASMYMDEKRKQRSNKPKDNSFIHTFRKND